MDRLWNRTDRSNGCWIWLGAKVTDGYGEIMVNGKQIRTHRLAWELTNGSIPKGMCVCHRCDNPSCINPKHLFLGTNNDNIQDRIKKGRRGGPKGGENYISSKLKSFQIKEIRMLKGEMSERKIAEEYHIGKSQVHRIVSKQCWKSLP